MMKKNIGFVVLIAILVIQPFVITVSPDTLKPITKSKSAVMSQKPGSRLSPGEYTNHVPIFINGTSDFGAQGWPGSGTADDPYLIEGLNITANVGKPCIEIINVHSYFVIRDVWLKVFNNGRGISLDNTSHGMIEYATIDASNDNGVFANDCTYLSIESSYIYSENYMAEEIQYSEYITLHGNVFNSTSHRAVKVESVNHLESIQNEYLNRPNGWYTTNFINCNNTVFDNDEFWNGNNVGLRISLGYNITIISPLAHDNDHGIDLSSCHNAIIDSGTFYNLGYGVVVSSSENIKILGPEIHDSNHLMGLNSVVDSTFRDVVATNLATEGIRAENSANLLFSNISISGPTDGFIANNDQNMTINGIDMYDTVRGYYFHNTDNITMTNCVTDIANTYGVELDDVSNFHYANNMVRNTGDSAVYFFNNFANVSVSQSTFMDLSAEAIVVDTGADAEIFGNTITNCSDWAIIVADTPRTTVRDNVIEDSYSGIEISNAINASVYRNEITVQYQGMMSDTSDNGEIINNTITGSKYGLWIYASQNLTIDSNVFTNCGIAMNEGWSIGYYRHTIQNNQVNGAPILYVVDDTSFGVVNGASYGQIILVNASAEIDGGVFDRCTTGVHVYYSDHVSIHNAIFRRNVWGVHIYHSSNVSVFDSTIEGFGDETSQAGISVSVSQSIDIQNASVSHVLGPSKAGVQIIQSIFATVRDSEFAYNKIGVVAGNSVNITVDNSNFEHIVDYAIRAYSGFQENFTITSNQIINASIGIQIYRTQKYLVEDNFISFCEEYGIYVVHDTSDYGIIKSNTIEQSGRGIYLNAPDYVNITYNTLRWNAEYGLYAAGSQNLLIYNNIFAVNLLQNGYDTGIGTFWDDGVSQGNSWDDYIGPGTYNVDTDTIDRYPSKYLPTEPVINHLIDISYAEGTTGHYLEWWPIDDNLNNWIVEIDGSVWAQDIWNFNSIKVNIDGLAYGQHLVMVTVYDAYSNSVSDSILVNVFDDTPPTVSHESDTTLFVNSPNQMITWSVYDLHPVSYSVTADGNNFTSGTWDVQTQIAVDFQTLSLGLHEIVFTVKDIGGNTASDTVMINMLSDDTSPTIDSPYDITMEEGTVGNIIIWRPSDDHPSHFVVLLNGTEIASGEWAGASIVVSLDGLAEGTHEFTLTVYDAAYNSVSDSVIVTVYPAGEVPTTTTTPPPPIDSTMILIIIAGTGGTVALIALVYYIRKKRSS